MSSFFKNQLEQSEVKSMLIEKYFNAWASIMNNKYKSDKLIYLDLFSGPGRYEDGQESTPVKITKLILSNKDYRKKFVLIFNDKDTNHRDSLQQSITSLDGFNLLYNEPEFICSEVNEEVASFFIKSKLRPTFSFIDPFGYKGVTKELINGLTKDWGCDSILFFNFNRINSAIHNPLVIKHMKELFGKSRYNEMMESIKTNTTISKEDVILNYFGLAMEDIGIDYVLPFRFQCQDRNYTSHYLVFLTKSIVGYRIMKDIMANASKDKDSDVGTFQYIYNNSNQLSFLNKFEYSISSLKENLLIRFSKRTLTVDSIIQKHNINTPYVEKNYKDALKELENEKKIIADPKSSLRRKNTMAGRVKITFQ